MALFKLPSLKFLQRPAQPVPIPPAAGQVAPKPKSLTELERQMAAEQSLHARAASQMPQGSIPSTQRMKRSPLKKVLGITLLIAIPTGIIALVNLPYSAIRRPVAEKFPILLLPSYISLDKNYRLAITTFEQAQQLIGSATSPTDLELGEQKLEQTQKSLDAIPIDWVSDWSYYPYGGYSWRFSRSHFNATRAEVGRLKGKVFQEKNAQDLLFNAEQSLTTAQQNYPQAKTPLDRQTAIAQWQTALDQLQQIPGETLAGKSAQQNLTAYQRDFEATVGLAAGNQQTLMVLNTAREYSQRAAQQGQNPPHSAEEWQQIIELWEDAIAQVGLIPEHDLQGYAAAQKMRAEYKQNLGQIKIRLEAEETSKRAFEQAQQESEYLFRIADGSNRNQTIAQLKSIINLLKQVKPGTTEYLNTQAELISAQKKLDQFNP